MRLFALALNVKLTSCFREIHSCLMIPQGKVKESTVLDNW